MFNFTSIIKYLIKDIKYTIFNIFNIFKSIKSVTIFITFCFLISFWLLYSVFLCSFYFFYFFLKFLIFFKKKNTNIFKFKFEHNIKDGIYNNSFKINFFYYFFYIQKLKAFDLLYNLIFLLHFKKNKNFNYTITIVILLLILPLRSLIKFLTGFSYLTIKIASNLTLNLLDLNNYKIKKFSIFFDNFFLELNSSFLYGYIELIKNYNIYFDNNKLVLNPFWYELMFKNIENLKNSIEKGHKTFTVRMFSTKNIAAHPTHIITVNNEKPCLKTLIIQSSNNQRTILNIDKNNVKDQAVCSVDKGVLGKTGVYNYSPTTINTSIEGCKLDNINGWKDIERLNYSKKIAFKVFVCSFFQTDKIIVDGKITENKEYNFFIDRLIESYEKNTLPLEIKESLDSLLNFILNEDILNDPVKMAVYDYLIQTTIITTNGNIFIPELDYDLLPTNIKNILKLKE